MSQLVDPRPLEPPDNFICGDYRLVVRSSHGIYVPQYFVEHNKKTEDVSDWAWETCKRGPDDDFYWEAWTSILNNYELVDQGPNGLICRYRLQQEEDLFLVSEPYFEYDYDF